MVCQHKSWCRTSIRSERLSSEPIRQIRPPAGAPPKGRPDSATYAIPASSNVRLVGNERPSATSSKRPLLLLTEITRPPLQSRQHPRYIIEIFSSHPHSTFFRHVLTLSVINVKDVNAARPLQGVLILQRAQ
jgi:hypothetical protein